MSISTGHCLHAVLLRLPVSQLRHRFPPTEYLPVALTPVDIPLRRPAERTRRRRRQSGATGRRCPWTRSAARWPPTWSPAPPRCRHPAARRRRRRRRAGTRLGRWWSTSSWADVCPPTRKTTTTLSCCPDWRPCRGRTRPAMSGELCERVSDRLSERRSEWVSE